MTNEIISTFGPDPFALFQEWMDEATKAELNDPNAIYLATANAQGQPSVRTVLLKEANAQRGFKFHTNGQSQKGQEIQQNQNVEFCIHWKSTQKQIRVRGQIAEAPPEETDAYFAGRPRKSALGAWASQQSQPLESRETFENAMQEMEERFTNTQTIPRPAHWKGYWITPQTIEFWIGQENRLHTRFIYRKTNQSKWDANWLYP